MPHRFSKRQRIGVLILFLIIVSLQLVLFFAPQNDLLSVTPYRISLKSFEKEFEALQQKSVEESKPKIYPFNPNFITSYKVYTLGMSVEEIERLQIFRAKDRWVNSAKEFQQVTGVSDSLLHTISPFFKFPKWVTQAQQKKPKPKNTMLDLNLATAAQLQSVYGIGPKLSERILRYRSKFNGGFADMVELKAVYGLTDEVIERIKQRFVIKQPRSIVKINLNEAHQEDLVKIPFIDYELAYTIAEQRVLKEGFKLIEELTKLKDFPTDKLDIIKLYLYVN